MLLRWCLLGALLGASSAFIRVYPRTEPRPVAGDAGEPLFVTPLLDAGDLSGAREAARVGPLDGDGNITSYSGYFTVNSAYNSNLFFWYFPAMVGADTAPVLLWLQGGPGASSLFGLFSEHGPFIVTKDNNLALRQYAWSSTHHVLYIDNPVGTGFSFTNDDNGYATNQTAVGKDLYNALLQFFTMFPELQSHEFYVTGESYAGKYVPSISYTIHTENPSAALKINFKGMAIGNGLCDPEHMFHYSEYVYQLGLFDSHARDYFQEKEQLAVQHIQNQEWLQAFEVFDELLNGDMYEYGTAFFNFTGYTHYFNFLYANPPPEEGDLGSYLQQAEVRQAIHVGNNSFHSGREVEEHLKLDVMQSVRPWVEELLQHYRVLIYNGQLDIIVAYPNTVGFLNALQWPEAAEYKTAPRYPWLVNGNLAGYVKTAGNLTEILVRDAGHMVPSDQPLWGFDLITRFSHNKPYH